MNSQDVTKPINHLFWLWLAIGSVFFFTLRLAYIQAQANASFREKLADKDTKLQIEISKVQVKLAVLESQSSQIFKSIEELKTIQQTKTKEKHP